MEIPSKPGAVLELTDIDSSAKYVFDGHLWHSVSYSGVNYEPRHMTALCSSGFNDVKVLSEGVSP